jgi:5-methylcytosine-specific restriction protein A
MPTINKPKKKSTYIKHTLPGKAYNYAWHKLRNAYLMQHPLCERCLLDNKTVAAEEVHHIKPLSTAKDEMEVQSLLLDSNNIMALCKDCHTKVHRKKETRLR